MWVRVLFVPARIVASGADEGIAGTEHDEARERR